MVIPLITRLYYVCVYIYIYMFQDITKINFMCFFMLQLRFLHTTAYNFGADCISSSPLKRVAGGRQETDGQYHKIIIS